MRITIEMSFLHHQLRGNNGKVNVATVTIIAFLKVSWLPPIGKPPQRTGEAAASQASRIFEEYGNQGRSSYPHHTVDMESAINKFRH